MLFPVIVTLYGNISTDLLSDVLICIAFISVSFGLSTSIFTSGMHQLQSRIYFLIFISSIISLFLVQGTGTKNIFPGQEEDFIVSITGRVLKDSKEISGGIKIFVVEIQNTEDINSTRTSASGSLTIASRVDVYKGQLVSLRGNNILRQNYAIVFIDQKNIKVLDWEPRWNIRIMKKRAQILTYLKQHIRRMNGDSAVLFTALFVGIKENPKGELFTALRRAGGSHILALSGMHLGIISFGIMFVLTGLFGKKISFNVTLFVVLFYVFLVSAGPSLTRAVILFILIGFLGFSGRRIDIFHILTICFLIQTVSNPGSAFELSFQLSYLALGGIILVSGQLSRLLPGIIPVGIRGVLAASISAQLFTAPLVLHYFGVIYPVGIISGIILVPIVTLFIWTGILCLLPFPWFLQRLIYSVSAVLYRAIEVSADFFSRFPALSVMGAILIGVILIVFYCVSFFLGIQSMRHPE